MATFEELSKSEGFRKTYLKAAEAVYSATHTSDKRNLRVLDVGGGSGEFGRVLLEYFGGRVDYFNLDCFPDLQNGSPGTIIVDDSVFAYSASKKFGPFDVVSMLNDNPVLEIGRLWPKEREFGEYDYGLQRLIKPRTYNLLLRQHQRIILINAALLCRDGGIGLMSAVFQDGTIDHIRRLSRKDDADAAFFNGFTMDISAIINSGLDFDTALKFTEVDTRSPKKEIPRGLIELYQQNHALLVLQFDVKDRKNAERVLEESMRSHKCSINEYLNPHLDDYEIVGDF